MATEITYDEAYDNTEYRPFKDMTANHCLLYELQLDFKWTPEYYKDKFQALHKENKYKYNYDKQAFIYKFYAQ